MIPKTGKPDYSAPKAYRPISLTPFIFKLLERVNAWNIMETALKNNPLHKRQHAYRMGRSTESAISQVLNEIEKGLNTPKGFTLATCIDISSAFDRLNPIKAADALIKKGVNKDIALWYKDYLTNRHAYIDIKGVQTIRQLNIGCPQGGVLSTLLWNIAFDDLLGLFNNSRIICVGYADDGCLLITGKDIKNLYLIMDEALEQCQKWAESYGLDISPEKTEYLLCTRQLRKSYTIPGAGLKLKGVVIERSETIKYLGLSINHKLNWGPHIEEKVKAAKRHIFRLKGFIGKTWGPCPEMTKLAYTSCIRPAMTYASFAFANGLAKKHIAKLNAVQSLALRMTCNARRGTPLNGLEIIMDVPPIDLFIKAEASKAAFRIIGTNDEPISQKGHLSKCNAKLDEAELWNIASDTINKELVWEKNYTTSNTKHGNDIGQGNRCYTDGSKTSRGTGAGFCIMKDDKVQRTRAFALSKNATVFQAEIHAIRRAIPFIREEIKPGETIQIMCDSQAAIKALDSTDTTSEMVLRTKELLNNLGKDYVITINWIKAHVEHKGNELADILAKTGCGLTPEEETPVSYAHVKATINQKLYQEWDRRWQAQGDCRQTFQFFPCTDRSKSKKICKMNRHDLGIMVRYLTGHAHLRRHNKIAKTPQPVFFEFPEMSYKFKDPDDWYTDPFDRQITCRICKLKGREETPYHLVTECLGAWRARRTYLGCYSMEGENPIQWEPPGLLEFFKHFDLENKPNTL